jgi:hypothetical protein
VTLNTPVLLIRIPLQRLVVLRFDRPEVLARVFVSHPVILPNFVGDVNVLAVRKGLVVEGRDVDVDEAVPPLLEFWYRLLQSFGLWVDHLGVELY